MNTYKIILIGDGGVGKTTYVKRLLQNVFEKRYIATLGVEVAPFRKEGFVFNLWDCAGQEKFCGLQDGYYIQAHGAIFFFDLTSKISLKNLKSWVSKCSKVTGNIPCVIVGLKSDISKGKIKDEEILNYIGDIPFVKVSSKNNENIEVPIEILRNLLN